MSKPKPTTILAATADGRAFVLCWHPREDAVTLAVSDSRNGERFEPPVTSDRALEAFYHPFAYAA
jgi:hypothetical protein